MRRRLGRRRLPSCPTGISATSIGRCSDPCRCPASSARFPAYVLTRCRVACFGRTFQDVQNLSADQVTEHLVPLVGSVAAVEFFVTSAASVTFVLTIGLSYWRVIAGLALGGASAPRSAPMPFVTCRQRRLAASLGPPPRVGE